MEEVCSPVPIRRGVDLSAIKDLQKPRAKKLKVGVLAVLLLTGGCDRIEQTTPIGKPLIETREVSCTHLSYCMTCMPGAFAVEMDCKVKLSHHCPGIKQAQVKVQQVELLFESGKIEQQEQVEVLKDLTICR